MTRFFVGLAAYGLVGLLTFGYSYNADFHKPPTMEVNGKEVALISAEADNSMSALMAAMFWPCYWTVTAFKPLRRADSKGLVE